MSEQLPYDSFLLVSFGGPEGRDDVMPFLENVLRGKNVPRQRMLEVAEHYYHFEGRSPINEQNRQLLRALEEEFRAAGIELPMYWGNRNWHPLLPDTLSHMRDQGCRRALAFFTSMFSSYSGCRQYRENIQAAQEQVGPGAPQVDKLRNAFNHPLFISAVAARVREVVDQLPDREAPTKLLFTAHSIPMVMAQFSAYERQLREAARLVAAELAIADWELVYQSRSGPPTQSWLEPDVVDRVEQLAADGLRQLIVCPLGFISDHIEVLFDLDTELRDRCEEWNIAMVRAPTVGTHPDFVRMIRLLVEERLDPSRPRQYVGQLPISPDTCPPDCCLYPHRPLHPAASGQ
ncbi:MAG: ferrochelatase [Pirellulaceae bacterium]|nr:MAG: ferrochelatase [Pirellulaceae bacterium]